MQANKEKHLMSKDESYSQRRMMFKNIWQTAMNIVDKDDILNKPKVIKTLRLDDIDRCVVGKTKKQRLKDLRHVCNKILDFCDRQDADDKFYEQWVAETKAGTAGIAGTVVTRKIFGKTPKKKIHRKRRLKKTKSMIGPPRPANLVIGTASEQRNTKVEHPSTASPIKPKRSPLKKIKKKVVKSRISPGKISLRAEIVSFTSDDSKSNLAHVVERKQIKKKYSKRKKPSISSNATAPINTLKVKGDYLAQTSKSLPPATKTIVN